MRRIVLMLLGMLLAAGLTPLADCYGKTTRHVRRAKPARHTRSGLPAGATQTPGLIYKLDVKAGSGPVAATGETVSVQYTGWLYDAARRDHRGTQIDNSQARGQPFQFKLGAGQVIQGWDVGIAGMKVGGERILAVPGLGYGTSAGGVTIPPNTPMLYDVILLGVQSQ